MSGSPQLKTTRNQTYCSCELRLDVDRNIQGSEFTHPRKHNLGQGETVTALGSSQAAPRLRDAET